MLAESNFPRLILVARIHARASISISEYVEDNNRSFVSFVISKKISKLMKNDIRLW